MISLIFTLISRNITIGNADKLIISALLMVTLLIQVSYSLQDPAIRAPEINSLKASMMELGLKQGLIVTMREELELSENGFEIRIVPAWKWALNLIERLF
ncbi:MAG: hypothetical protein AB9834_18510 [Lentimicrobium sp.]